MAVDLTVARGLDYYTGMVFEVKVEELGGEGQVLGGGSYKLLHLFGLPDLDPCCGFGLGFDRVLLALEAQAAASGREEAVPGEVDDRPHIAIAPNKADHMPLLPLVASLREAGASRWNSCSPRRTTAASSSGPKASVPATCWSSSPRMWRTVSLASSISRPVIVQTLNSMRRPYWMLSEPEFGESCGRRCLLADSLGVVVLSALVDKQRHAEGG